MGSPLADVVDGYAQLGTFLVERWRAHVSAVASKIDSGGYGINCAVADLAKSASLAVESGFLVASEAFDAAAILTGRQHEAQVSASQLFFSPVAGATLTLAGPLTDSLRSDSLPVSVISFVASAVGVAGQAYVLGAAETAFSLSADATGHRGATYIGKVVASASGTDHEIDVWIQVA